MTNGSRTPMPDTCWVDERVRIRTSSIDGHGLFAASPLPGATVVAILSGELVSDEELQLRLRAASTEHRYIDTVCIDDGINLVLPVGQTIHFGNHSCEPNLWHIDPFTLATRRAIRAGEELTVDYATQTVASSFRMECRCALPTCRGVITGNDWQIPEWRALFAGHVVPAVASRIGEAA